MFFSQSYLALPDLHSFPTRRSSDLSFPLTQAVVVTQIIGASGAVLGVAVAFAWYWPEHPVFFFPLDRKSTRLNSSHTVISYAVFCLKKKNWKAGREQGRACVVTYAI